MTGPVKKPSTRAAKETARERKDRLAKEALARTKALIARIKRTSKTGRDVEVNGTIMSGTEARQWLDKEFKTVHSAAGDKNASNVGGTLEGANAVLRKAYNDWYSEDVGSGSSQRKLDGLTLKKADTATTSNDGDVGGQVGEIFRLLSSGRITEQNALEQAKVITDLHKETFRNNPNSVEKMTGSYKAITNIIKGISENLEYGIDGSATLGLPPDQWLRSRKGEPLKSYPNTPQGDIDYVIDRFNERQSGVEYSNNETSLTEGLNGRRARYGKGYVPQHSGYDTAEELDSIRSALLWGGYITDEEYAMWGSTKLNAKENKAFTSFTKDLNKTGSTIEEYLNQAFEEAALAPSDPGGGGGGGGGGKDVEQMDPEEIRQGVEKISGQTLGRGIDRNERDQITDELGSEATAASAADQQYDVESRTRRKLRERRPGDAAVTDVMSTFDAFASMMGAGGSFGQSSSQPESIRGPMTGAGGMR